MTTRAMTAVEKTVILCDGAYDGCVQLTELWDDSYLDGRNDIDQRAILEAKGWHVNEPGCYDYCPPCWEKKQAGIKVGEENMGNNTFDSSGRPEHGTGP